jgi:hypothetical protein
MPRSTALTITASDVIVLRGPPFMRCFIARCASGVFPSSFATGVGHKPESVAIVRGTNGCRWYAVPLRVIPDRGQVSENSLKPPSKQSCDVLHDDVSRSKLANQSCVLGPKTRTLALNPDGVDIGAADVLAGEATAENVDGSDPVPIDSVALFVNVPEADSAHVMESLGVGEVPLEDSPAELGLLDLPERSHSCSLEAEIEAANAGEEASDREHVTGPSG